MKNQAIPTHPGVTYRVAAVDEEMGTVWLHQDFGGGSVPGGKADVRFSTFEAFKVYGGKIHAAEAILEAAWTERPDVIVVGARQRRYVARILGSVSAKVANESPCRVEVVPAR